MKLKILLTLGFISLFLLSGFVFANGEIVEVEIKKSAYHPQTLKITPGTTVKWVNQEKRQYHSVWFKAEGFPEAEYIFPDETWERTFDKPGTYPYSCEPHPEMTGTIIVE